MKGANKKLGEILLQEEVISRDQLKQALDEQTRTGGFLGAALVRLGFIDEEELTTFLVKQCRIPYLKLSGFKVNDKIASLIPGGVCRQYQVLPVDKLGNLLTVAMVNPLDIEALERVKQSVPYRIKPIICSWYDFEKIFESFYGPMEAQEPPDAHWSDNPPATAPAEPERVAPTAVAEAAEATVASRAARVPPPPANLVQEMTFDTFLVAEANSFTVALAHEVAESPGQEHNPFFLYGEPGLGKTHLVNAVGHVIAARERGDQVCYVAAGQLSDEMIEAIRADQLDRFRARYQQVGLLILDDVQFLAGRDRLQEEFFHLFNQLYQRSRQIVLVSDTPPKLLPSLEQRLLSRFEGGMVAALEAPDFETRLRILEKEVQAVGGAIAGDVLDLLAQEIPSNVRELQGALKRLLAYSALVGHEITTDLAREILKHLFTRAVD